MNRPRQPPQPGQGQGFSGRTRIILPGEEGDPNRVIIPGQQNYNNNPYNNGNLNSNNMYQHPTTPDIESAPPGCYHFQRLLG